ncbi:MAG: DNA repair protein RecN [Deltaproteobacteria bacterium]|nr:DNA repair protein RecN [Deltaproteobacteria bacterium]
MKFCVANSNGENVKPAVFMLRELRIKNFAIIDEVVLQLGRGLNIITGETGAGKSIILNALGLISGERGSSDIIRHQEEEATVEALFDTLPPSLNAKLCQAGFDVDGELVIKRVLNRSGKNRIYLNGSLCPLSLLAEIGTALVHIYGQHEHHTLLQAETHLNLLDAFADLDAKAKSMKERFDALSCAWDRLTETRDTLEKQRREKAFLEAQAEEIAGSRLRPGEEEELRSSKNILAHSEKLHQGCREGEEMLYEGDAALVGRLGKYAGKVRELAAIDEGLKPTVELLDSSWAQLQEAASQLRRYADRIHFDPRSLEQIEDRLAEIQRLKRKYNADIEDILRMQAGIEETLASLEQGEEQIVVLERAFEEARQAAWDMAEKLSHERQRAAKKLKREMEREIRGLGMPETIFEVRFVRQDKETDDPPFFISGKKLTERGMDQVEFHFSPNPGEPVKPLAKIASGGELSRLMLALKALVLTPGVVSTLLFDEVDAGIGGRVAEIVGKKLQQVAALHQVITVTHLPQIAAIADSHYVVHKEVEKGRTFTHVKRLSEPERVSEVARMLGGVKITEKTLRHAEEMIEARIKANG